MNIMILLPHDISSIIFLLLHNYFDQYPKHPTNGTRKNTVRATTSASMNRTVLHFTCLHSHINLLVCIINLEWRKWIYSIGDLLWINLFIEHLQLFFMAGLPFFVGHPKFDCLKEVLLTLISNVRRRMEMTWWVVKLCMMTLVAESPSWREE